MKMKQPEEKQRSKFSYIERDPQPGDQVLYMSSDTRGFLVNKDQLNVRYDPKRAPLSGIIIGVDEKRVRILWSKSEEIMTINVELFCDLRNEVTSNGWGIVIVSN